MNPLMNPINIFTQQQYYQKKKKILSVQQHHHEIETLFNALRLGLHTYFKFKIFK